MGTGSQEKQYALDWLDQERERFSAFDLEIWHWSQTTIAADATLYWYARPGGTDE